jgi:hypothetical protein
MLTISDILIKENSLVQQSQMLPIIISCLLMKATCWLNFKSWESNAFELEKKQK